MYSLVLASATVCSFQHRTGKYTGITIRLTMTETEDRGSKSSNYIQRVKISLGFLRFITMMTYTCESPSLISLFIDFVNIFGHFFMFLVIFFGYFWSFFSKIWVATLRISWHPRPVQPELDPKRNTTDDWG